MSKRYFSCRPRIDGSRWDTPKNYLRYAFAGINFQCSCIASNPSIDGRWLYSLEFSPEYSEEDCNEFFDVIIEGLSPWASHAKSEESAAILFNKLTGGEL